MKEKKIKRKLTRTEVASLGGKACLAKKGPKFFSKISKKLWAERKKLMKLH
jgi:hypothetical protein